MSAVLPLPVWDLDGWDAERGFQEEHVELVRGVPTVSPGEAVSNRRVCDRVCATINAQVGPGWFAVTEIEVTVRTGTAPTVRRPDVTVLAESAPQDVARHVPADVALVAEVVSPTSAERDWVTKVGEYASAGIQSYLVIDPGAGILSLFTRPGPDGYTERADVDARTAVWAGSGAPVRLVVEELLGRRRT